MKVATAIDETPALLYRELMRMLRTPGTSVSSATFEDSCYHEAGHAVVAHVLGLPLKRIEVTRPRTADATFLDARRLFRTPGRPRDHILRRRLVVVLWAGLASEAMHSGRRNWIGAGTDVRRALELVGRLNHGRPTTHERAFAGYVRASKLLRRRSSRRAVAELAAALREESRISGARATRIISRAVGATHSPALLPALRRRSRGRG